MKIEIRSRTFPMTDSIKDFSERRLLLALSKYGPELSRVGVILSDINGPRGGVDKQCVIRVLGRDGWGAIVRDVESDMYAAIERSVDRVARAVARRVAQRQDIPASAIRRATRSLGRIRLQRVAG
ncbi:MAG: HPF/RaiA family ribosome-associated protein [Deltaproteobacteria bacterium]|nr:HPF/RaiA family ribosome-associated protein [Deltaproteobacteria bacterium]